MNRQNDQEYSPQTMRCFWSLIFYQSILQKANDLLMLVSSLLICTLLPMMTLVVFLQVVMRYLFSSPFSWAEELVKFLLVWLACFGAAYALRKKEHVALLVIREHLPTTLQSGLILIIHVVLLVFFILTFVESVGLVLSERHQMTNVMRISIAWVYLGIPISFAFMIMFELEGLLEDIRQRFLVKE